MLNSGLKCSNGFKYKIPVNAPVQYPAKNYDVDPYMMGVFLGDGCCLEKYLTLSSETEEIPTVIGNIIGAKPIKNSGKNYSWNFEWLNEIKTVNWIGGNGCHRTIERKRPKTLEYFEKYKEYLIQYSYLKDIPPEYKYGSVEQRFALVQGLMDTDGSIAKNDGNRYNMKYTSTSLKLINSLQEILFSLGYSSTVHTDKRQEKYKAGICYNLTINIPNEEKYKFFKLTRKKEIALKAKEYKKRKDYTKIAITDVVPLKENAEMVCIYVDNEEHLYLTNDYIVTHNTTLVNHIIAALGIDPEIEVAFVALTGKAAQVLKEKGNPNPTTVHKLIYRADQQKDGSYKFKLKEQLDNPDLKVIVVDEVSMLPKTMWEQLLTYPVYVLALGDPGQLSPINKEEDNHLLEHPHVFLDEIMRQALDSEIIRCSMWIRQGHSIASYKAENKEVMILNQKDIDNDNSILTWADQILCATNKKRNELNFKLRKLYGFGEEPQVGDKIVSLKNHWDFGSVDDVLGTPLTNGTIGTILSLKPDKLYFPRDIAPEPVPILLTNLIDNMDTEYLHVPIDYNSLKTGQLTLTPVQEYKIKKRKNCYREPPFEFAYAYALTVWKAQGSQWDKVLVFEEGHPYEREEHLKAMYTAATRAISRLVIVRK